MYQQQLLSLYISVLIPLLSDWINDEDLCCLDTAVCCKELRNYFLRVLTQCNISNHDWRYDPEDDKLAFYHWAVIRGLALKSFFISEEDTSDDRNFLRRFKHMPFLESDCGKALFQFVSKNKVSLDRVSVDDLNWTSMQFLAIGHHITEIRIPSNDQQGDVYAKACPNAQIAHLDFKTDLTTIQSIIDGCSQLDSIYGCSCLKRLLKIQNCGTFTCDLKRTSEVDESAVRLGEGKYFNLTGLHVYGDPGGDCTLLAPLVRHLRKLLVCKCSPIISIIAPKCDNLTCLTVWLQSKNDAELLLMLLVRSSKLMELHLIDKSLTVEADPLLHTMSLHCPLLEKFTSNCSVNSPQALSTFLAKCSSMKHFTFGEKFSVALHSGERYSTSISVSICKLWYVETIIQCFPEIQDVTICSCPEAEAFNNSVLRYVPQLTSLTVCRGYKNPNCSMIVYLSGLPHLTILKFNRVGELDLRELQCDLSKLRTLELFDCGCDSKIVNDLGSLCSNLIRLNLAYNKELRTSDVAKLLQSCAQLEYLDLCKCKLITVSLLSIVRTTGLKYLNVADTRITKKKVRAVQGRLSCRVMWKQI